MEDLGLQFANSHRMNSQSEAVPTVVPRDTLCTKCLKCIKDWLLVDFKKETILLVKLAGPVVSTGVDTPQEKCVLYFLWIVLCYVVFVVALEK